MSIEEVSNDGQEMPTTEAAPSVDVEDVPMQAKGTQPSSASVPQPSQPAKTFFGLAQDAARRQGYSRPVFNDDYVARFPEDPYGQETAPNARAYRVYVEEAAAFDENMVGQSRDGLDVMLVFVSQNLQADFSEMSALLLHDLLVVQLAMVDGATVNVTTPSINPAEKFEPDVIDIWINGLWVVSLTTSLVVALAAVLVKQWLHRYMTFPSGTPRLRSHIRQFRFMGLEKWRVRIIIGMLPIIMHISLMLFFTGLALFYVPLRVSLTWAVGSITVLVCVLYLISNIIPIVFPQCPYQTPLTDFIHHICQVARFGIQTVRQLWRKTVHHCSVAWRDIRKLDIPSEHPSFRAPIILPEHQASEVSQSQSKSLTQLEFIAVQDTYDTLSIDALDWLYHMSSNPTVHSLVLQGISGLPAASRSYAETKWSGASNMQRQRYQLVEEALSIRALPGQPWVLERLCRSYLFLPAAYDDEEPEMIHSLHARAPSDDPRIRAAIFVPAPLINGGSPSFIASHWDVLMPHLVWDKVVQLVITESSRIGTSHTGSSSKKHDLEERGTFAHCLSAVFLPAKTTTLYEQPGTVTIPMMTARQVVRVCHPEIWDTLLHMPLLAPYDSVPIGSISLHQRTLIAAGRFALSHIVHNRHNLHHFTAVHCQIVELLTCAVRLASYPDFADCAQQELVVLDFFCTVITGIHGVSFSPLLELQDQDYISECRSIIQTYYCNFSFKHDFHYPSLNCLLPTWSDSYPCIRLHGSALKSCDVFSSRKEECLLMPMIIMDTALSHGHEEAYRIFRDDGWMGLIFTERIICCRRSPLRNVVINGYIRGLYTLTPDSNRREFCEYLYQPQQLVLAFMLIVASTWFESSTGPVGPLNALDSYRDHIIKLAKICPTHPSWKECDTALKAILAWAHTPNQEISLFPWPPSLQNLSATVLVAFDKYPLVDEIARRFSSQEVRENLEVGLKMLHTILDNTGSVEGVLMPDLENQTSIDESLSHAKFQILALDEGRMHDERVTTSSALLDQTSIDVASPAESQVLATGTDSECAHRPDLG
ncbi:hypothetical protein BDZ89DRAFT_637228 [Hymenopellis radicata]|nr:hypothetical protein BDZ89DRAFT_637228 [Hymenopellis radicata]